MDLAVDIDPPFVTFRWFVEAVSLLKAHCWKANSGEEGGTAREEAFQGGRPSLPWDRVPFEEG